jgi:hypothetical protein
MRKPNEADSDLLLANWYIVVRGEYGNRTPLETVVGTLTLPDGTVVRCVRVLARLDTILRRNMSNCVHLPKQSRF